MHPIRPVEIFSNISTPFCSSVDHPLTYTKIFTERVPGVAGELFRRGIKRKRGSQNSDFGPVEGYITVTVTVQDTDSGTIDE